MGLARQNGFPVDDVSLSFVEKLGIVVQGTDSGVTGCAKQRPYFFSGMAVVNDKVNRPTLSFTTRGKSADSAESSLGGEHSFVLLQRNFVFMPKMPGPIKSFRILIEMLVKYGFHVWNERIFGTARGIGISGTCWEMQVHPSPVKEATAFLAGSELPSAWARFKSFVGFDFPVAVSAFPVVKDYQAARFTGMLDTADLGVGSGKISNSFYGLTRRAYVLIFGNCRDSSAEQPPMSLKGFFGYFRIVTKVTGDHVRALHVSVISKSSGLRVPCNPRLA